jgi:hypothetical protein
MLSHGLRQRSWPSPRPDLFYRLSHETETGELDPKEGFTRHDAGNRHPGAGPKGPVLGEHPQDAVEDNGRGLRHAVNRTL